MEILNDLSLPVDSPNKNILAVVATISLGVGVDVRVKNVVCLGLGSTPENIIQEAGRCQRGKAQLDNSEGLAVFLHKGSVAAIHCPPDSDCRELVTDPPQYAKLSAYSDISTLNLKWLLSLVSAASVVERRMLTLAVDNALHF